MSHVITLDEDDYFLLLLVLGYATGAAMKAGSEGSITPARVLRLANVIHRDNPAWKMYVDERGKPL